MKVKGFTLIELLAVIVILAIIALIAVPIILNIIGSSKKSAVLRSGELYLKAVETAVARENLKTQFNPTTCVIVNDGNLTCDEDKTLTIEVNGSKPTSGTITLEKGKIKEVTDMTLTGFELEKKPGEKLKIKGTSTELEPPSLPEDDKVVCTDAPNLEVPEGLIPVVYSNNNWVVSDITSKWYNYCNQEWANAVILNAGVTKNVGDTVNVSSEVKGMFVYIPRYEYKIDGQYGKGGISAELPGEIEINFINKETTTASEGYHIHPAFTFGTEELSGIWVGKFETTGTSSVPTILPSVESLRDQTVSEQFTTAQKFNTYVNNNNLDFHMAKNSEWGAAAYLSQSKYGKYGNSNYTRAEKQIMVNNCASISTGVTITGVGADSQDVGQSSSTCTTNTYTTSKGQAASTTGNITGIYDMSGGEGEYVMGVLTNQIGDNSGINFSTLDPKYYDNYTTDDETTACNGGICYGHALSETSEWYNDLAYFIFYSLPWLERGANCNSKSIAGVFSFSAYGGSSERGNSFRIVLVGA